MSTYRTSQPPTLSSSTLVTSSIVLPGGGRNWPFQRFRLSALLPEMRLVRYSSPLASSPSALGMRNCIQRRRFEGVSSFQPAGVFDLRPSRLTSVPCASARPVSTVSPSSSTAARLMRSSPCVGEAGHLFPSRSRRGGGGVSPPPAPARPPPGAPPA